MGLGVSQKWGRLSKKSVDILRAHVFSSTPGAEEISDIVGYVENAGIPTSLTPDFVGQLLHDTTNNNFYIAYARTAGAWRLTSTAGSAGLFYQDQLVVPKTSGKGILIDLDAPGYGWHDIIGNVTPKDTGVGTPVRAVYAGGTVGQFSFAANDICDFEYHIPHDYAPGTDLYIHIHWSHTGTSISGNAQFTFYHQYAKGHNQENFPTEKNVVVTYATTNIATTPQYRHRIDEVQLSSNGGSATLIDSASIEVDALIIGAMKLTSLPTIGGGGKLFVHFIDIHYQSTMVATKNKAPNFYT